MADNFVSYNRFTTLPPNIADYGDVAEVLKRVSGTPDRNPALSPMAAPRTSLRRLSLKPGGSDSLRLGSPEEPAVDPYEGPQSTLGLSRSALRKLSGNIVADLQEQVQGGAIADPEARELIMGSIGRVHAMVASLTEIQQLTSGIYMRSIAASRG